jgi:hypothetical protein
MMMRLRSESGQVIPITMIVMLSTLLGICALVMDVGAWFESSRKLQSVADAAALAAVQDLPAAPSSAASDAQSYAQANGTPLTSNPVISSTRSANDTITVSTTAQAPLFFSRVVGITSATVHAHAVAQVSGASRVSGKGIDAHGTGEPIPLVLPASAIPPASSFGQQVSISWGAGYQLGSGQFGILDFSQGHDSTAPKDIADWITNGYSGTLGTGSYPGINGNKTMSSPVDDAMTSLAANHPTILLPIYTSSGSDYQIAGWAAFNVSSWSKGSGTSTLTGSFTRLDMKTTGPPAQYFGAGHMGLTG